MLSSVNSEADRMAVVRALAIVKHGVPGPGLTLSEDDLTKQFSSPGAVISHNKGSWILVDRTWLGLGDWVADWFVLEIKPQLLLENRDGRQIPIPQPSSVKDLKSDHAILLNASARDVLTFISRRVDLNSFTPSNLDHKVSGVFPVADWLTFLDVICREVSVAWTRRGDNIIFTAPQDSLSHKAGRLGLVDRKGESLTAFLQNLAETFNMELILEDGLAHIQVDIHAQGQTWDEVLDCLSMMNGFHWFLVRSPGERARLFIQKE